MKNPTFTATDLAAIATALEWALIEDDGAETMGMAKALAKARNALGYTPRQTGTSISAWAADARAIHAEAETFTPPARHH